MSIVSDIIQYYDKVHLPIQRVVVILTDAVGAVDVIPHQKSDILQWL